MQKEEIIPEINKHIFLLTGYKKIAESCGNEYKHIESGKCITRKRGLAWRKESCLVAKDDLPALVHLHDSTLYVDGFWIIMHSTCMII